MQCNQIFFLPWVDISHRRGEWSLGLSFESLRVPPSTKRHGQDLTWVACLLNAYLYTSAQVGANAENYVSIKKIPIQRESIRDYRKSLSCCENLAHSGWCHHSGCGYNQNENYQHHTPCIHLLVRLDRNLKNLKATLKKPIGNERKQQTRECCNSP